MAVREIQAVTSYINAPSVREQYRAIFRYVKTWKYSCHGYIRFVIPKYIYRASTRLTPCQFYVFIERVTTVLDRSFTFPINDDVYYSVMRLCMDSNPLLASAIASRSTSSQIYEYLIYRLFKVIYSDNINLFNEFLTIKLFTNLLRYGTTVAEDDLVLDLIRYLDTICRIDMGYMWWYIWNFFSVRSEKRILAKISDLVLKYNNDGYRAEQIRDLLDRL